MPLNPAERKFFAQIAAQQDPNATPLEQLTIDEFRKGIAFIDDYVGEPANISFVDTHVPARDGYQIPIRIYNDNIGNNSPVMIFYPGCGYVHKLFEINAICCSRIAEASGIKVIVVNFRLAPEYPLPTSMYDGYDAACYISTHAQQFGIDPKKLILGGYSSGANCAAIVSNLSRNQFFVLQQILLNGVYDFTLSNTDYKSFEKEDQFLTPEVLAYICKQYGVSPDKFSDPLFSPYFETNLSGVPPTTIVVAEFDGIRSESEAYYKKLKAAGNKVEKIVIPGQTHNTMAMRKALSDGPDPAQVIAKVIKDQVFIRGSYK